MKRRIFIAFTLIIILNFISIGPVFKYFIESTGAALSFYLLARMAIWIAFGVMVGEWLTLSQFKDAVVEIMESD